MRHISALALAILLAGCGFSAPVAKRTPPPPVPPTPLSSVAVTLSLPADAIARELNRKTAVKIAEVHGQAVDCKITRCVLDLIATRDGLATVTARDGSVSVTMPFAIAADIQARALLMNLTAKGQGTGIAHATAALSILPNWSVRAHSSGDIRLTNNRVTLGSLRLDLTDTLNKDAAKLSQPMFTALDRDIPKLLRLRPQAEKLWAAAFRPIRIGKKPLTWLLLEPQTIRFASPQTSDNALSVALAVEARARIVVTDAPPTLQPTPLPDLLPLIARSNAFSLSVPATLTYDDASHLAMQALEKNPVRLGNGMTVRFEQLAILPSGEDVVVEARFCVKQGWWDVFDWFDSCGTGYLRGVPMFEPQHQTVRIARVHYDVATEGVVLAIAHAFEGEALGKELEKRLVFPVAKDIVKMQNSVRRTFAKPAGRDIVVRGNVHSFGMPTLTWTADGFLATFTATGEVEATLNLR